MTSANIPYTVFVITALLTVVGCGRSGSDTAPAAKPAITGVITQPVVPATVPEQLEAVGAVKSRNTSLIAARITGAITAISVREGDRVVKGKVLLSISSAETSASAANAAALTEQAKHGAEEARAREQLAHVTLERYQKLFREEAVTRQELDSRIAEREMAKQALARAEAQVVAAREGARGANALAGYTRVTAPVTGIITSKTAEVGMTVFPGTQLLTIEQEGRYRLEIAAPESLLGKVKTGAAVTVLLEGNRQPVNGQIEEVVPTVDRNTRTFLVKIGLPVGSYRSGTYGRAMFTTGSRQGLLIPRSAVMERGALSAIWVVGNDKVARLRVVRTGQEALDKVEVLSGLNPGEQIVTHGADRITEGASIAGK